MTALLYTMPTTPRKRNPRKGKCSAVIVQLFTDGRDGVV